MTSIDNHQNSLPCCTKGGRLPGLLGWQTSAGPTRFSCMSPPRQPDQLLVSGVSFYLWKLKSDMAVSCKIVTRLYSNIISGWGMELNFPPNFEPWLSTSAGLLHTCSTPLRHNSSGLVTLLVIHPALVQYLTLRVGTLWKKEYCTSFMSFLFRYSTVCSAVGVSVGWILTCAHCLIGESLWDLSCRKMDEYLCIKHLICSEKTGKLIKSSSVTRKDHLLDTSIS